MRKLSIGNYLLLFHKNAIDFERGSLMRRIQCTLHLALGLIATIATLISGGLTPNAATAATYYVATNGNNSSLGTLSQPFRTIRKGVSVLSAGDTLYIRAGTYAESIVHFRSEPTIRSGTSWTNPVTIAAYPGETVTMRPSSGTSVVTLSDLNLRYIIFDGIIFDGINTSNETFYIGSGTNHIRTINSELKNGYDQNLAVAYGGDNRSSDFNEFINVKIHNARDSHGIYIDGGSNTLFDGCEIYNNVGYGIHFYSNNTVNNNIVRNSKFYNNGNGYRTTAFAIGVLHGDGNVVYNNIVWNNFAGIQVDGGSTNAAVYNNTVYSNTAGGYAGIVIGTGSGGAIVRNNIVYNNPATIQNSGSGTILSNNVFTDPKFVNAQAGDFHLQSTSPAINAGATISMVTTDFDGRSRPQGPAYAVGAFEYTTGAPPAPPTNLTVFP